METKKRYIADSSLQKVLSGRKGCYHENPKCRGLNAGKQKTTEITEQEIVNYDGLIAPCKFCCEFAEPIAKPAALPTTVFPTKEMVPIWTCSDGRKFDAERDALWYELDIVRRRIADRKK